MASEERMKEATGLVSISSKINQIVDSMTSTGLEAWPGLCLLYCSEYIQVHVCAHTGPRYGGWGCHDSFF